MAEALPPNFDWRSSPAHLYLLSYFRGARESNSVAAMSQWDYLELGESARSAIDRFLAQGLLVPCSVEEGLDQSQRAADLKKLLKQRGLKQGGTKSELIERIVAADRSAMEALIARYDVLKTSSHADTLLDDYLARERGRLESCRQKSLEALVRRDFREACRALAEHRKTPVHFRELGGTQWVGPYDGSHDIKLLGYVFAAAPAILEHLGNEQLDSLRVAVGMSLLWHEKASTWLPTTFATTLPSADVAANMLLCNARLIEDRDALRDLEVSEIRLQRFKGPGICELCDSAVARTYKSVDEIPELPIEGCMSESGCEVSLVPTYEWEGRGGVELEVIVRPSFDRLQELKEMLDAGLISTDEFESKKAAILKEL